MRISAAGNKATPRDAGFSLVELLAVMAILSLMIGAVVLNFPSPRSEADRATERMAVQLTRFLDDGAVAGEMRALGVDADGLTLFRHDGAQWIGTARIDWPETARIRLERDDRAAELPELAQPDLLFEPYGAVPDFALRLQTREAEYRLEADDRGRIFRTVEQ